MPSTVPEYVSQLPDYRHYLHVAVAVIENDDGEILIARRHDHLHQGGVWEFPGGKVEPGEQPLQALQRELVEELAIECASAHPLIRIPYSYPDRKVLLDVWRVTGFHGEARGMEGQPVAWVKKRALCDYRFPAANYSIIRAAQLPDRYLITPDPGPVTAWPEFLQQLRRSLQGGTELLQLRAPSLSDKDYIVLAQQVLACCQHYGARLLLNAEATILEQCDADGVHLNSRRLMAASQRPVGRNKLLAASCHSLEEVWQAQRIGADFALLSPVKRTSSHPASEPLGWRCFHSISERAKIPLYALGGMSLDDLDDAWSAGAQGIAAIGSLWPNGLGN